MRILFALVCAAVLTCVGTLPSYADKRVALVIGNGAYRNAPALVNPKNDAEAVGRALQALGFETIVATDLDRGGMNDVLDRFSHGVAGADIAFFYYSGHGMQFAGKNFLLPVDARLASADDVNRFRLMPLDDVIDVLQAARGARVIILDACRNNPVEEELKRRLASLPGANRDAYLSRGLGRLSSANGLLVAYATQAGDVAADGDGRDSPFTAAFLHNVGKADIDLRQMFFLVQDEVDRLTGGRQRPELSISLVGEFKLNIVVTSPAEAERAWAEAKDAQSPAVLEEFIKRYGDSFYAALARDRLEKLKSPGGATCRPDFVFREAFPGDRVCVAPSERDRAAADNAMAAERRRPEGGPYGPDSCKPGFVWREANHDDHVCVTPDTRARVREDNRLAAQP